MLSFIAERAAEEAPALVRPGGEQMTYGGLAMASAALMQALGERVGEVKQRLVGVAVADGAGFVASVLAVLEAGGVVLPLDLRRGTAALQADAERARAVAVIVGDAAEDRLEVVPGDPRRHALDAEACLALEAAGRRALVSRAALGLGVDAIVDQSGLDAASRVPLLGPLTHPSVLVGGALATLRAGGALLLVDALPPAEQAMALVRLGANLVTAPVATLLAIAAAAPTTMEVPRVIAVGASTPAQRATLARAFPSARWSRAYDLPEALRVATAEGDETAFCPLPGVSCVFGERTVEVASPTRMMGYLDDAVATGAALFERDGATWLRTAEGIVEVGGERVDPAALERAFRATAGVHEVAVLAVADAAGQRLYAFVSGSASALPRHPAKLVEIESLPHRADGAVDRDALRRMVSID